jgi:hypothetical protein
MPKLDLPVVFENKDLLPMAKFSIELERNRAPKVLLNKAESPMAKLFSALLLLYKAALPIAIMPLAAVSLKAE